MIRLLVAAAVLAWLGLALLFANVSFFQQPSLADRLRAYTPGASNRRSRVVDARSIRDVIGPLSSMVGARIASVFGVSEEARIRLLRVHATESATEFRVRQFAWTVGVFVVLAGISASIGLPLAMVALLVIALPLLTFLIIEQQLAVRSERWQRRVALELPVMAEQLAMLLTAGFSLGAALGRLTAKSNGMMSRDLQRVLLRIRQGVSETDAIGEWAKLAKVPSVDRLASVLRLNGETSDLGRLVAEEARQAREDSHRELLEIVGKKDQLVWVPVTVAALLPGCIFLAVPFFSALSFFSNN
jgi:tight adherence protein C